MASSRLPASETEPFGGQVLFAQEPFDDRVVEHRIVGRGDAARGLEARRPPGLFGEGADGRAHRHGRFRRGARAGFSGRGFDEVRPGQHGDHGGAVDEGGFSEQTRFENDFQRDVFAHFLAQRFDFVAHRIVFSAEHFAHADDDVDFVGSVFDGHRRFEHLHFQIGLRRGEAARYAGDGQSRFADGHAGRFDERGVDAHRSHVRDVGIVGGELHGFSDEPFDMLVRVGRAERSEVDARKAFPVDLSVPVLFRQRADFLQHSLHFGGRGAGTELFQGVAVFHSRAVYPCGGVPQR